MTELLTGIEKGRCTNTQQAGREEVSSYDSDFLLLLSDILFFFLITNDIYF
jgi:hypothetical protein